MIPGAFVAPSPDPRPAAPGRVWRRIGLGLVIAAGIGAVVWWMMLSPYSFRRIDLFETTSSVSFRQPGTYVVFIEYPGAAADTTHPVDVAVRSPGGKNLAVRSLVDDESGESESTYRVPGHEGRALAVFTIDDAGSYQVVAFPRPDESGTFDLDLVTRADIAVGRQVATSFFSTLWGAFVLVVIPFVAGVIALLVGRRQRQASLVATHE